MHSYYVASASGIKLHVQETGNPCGIVLLFIHGFSQNGLNWKNQLFSSLSRDFRIITWDLRGHGLSEKPIDGYDAKDWAGDVHALICTLGLIKPFLIGSSYGGLIILDYFRHYGDEYISGIVFVGVVTSFGTPEAEKFISSKVKNLIPELNSNDALRSSIALQNLIGLFTFHPLSLEDFYFILGFNTIVPYYVRIAMSSRIVSNNDILPAIRKPTLVIYGTHDQVITMHQTTYIMERIPHASLSLYPDCGHFPFWEDPVRFNHELRSFARNMF